MRQFFKNFGGGIIQQAGSFFLSWVVGLPIAGAAMTLLGGWFYTVPWPYLIAATSVTFAMTMTAILRLSQWWAWITPKNKLRFAGVKLAMRMDKQGEPPMGVGLGVDLLNDAHFPIEFHVKEIKSVVGNKINPAPTYLIRNVTIQGGNTGFFYDDPVLLNPDEFVTPTKCTLSCKVAYGRPGNLRYEMQQRLEIYIGFSEERVPRLLNATDAPPPT